MQATIKKKILLLLIFILKTFCSKIEKIVNTIFKFDLCEEQGQGTLKIRTVGGECQGNTQLMSQSQARSHSGVLSGHEILKT